MRRILPQNAVISCPRSRQLLSICSTAETAETAEHVIKNPIDHRGAFDGQPTYEGAGTKKIHKRLGAIYGLRGFTGAYHPAAAESARKTGSLCGLRGLRG